MSRSQATVTPLIQYWLDLAFPLSEFPDGPPQGAHTTRPPPEVPDDDPEWEADRKAHAEREQNAWHEILRRAHREEIEVHAYLYVESVAGKADRTPNWYPESFKTARDPIPADFFLNGETELHLSPVQPVVIYSRHAGGPRNARWRDPIVVERKAPGKDKGGRDSKYDYEGGLIELARAIHAHEVEVSLKSLDEHLKEWMTHKYSNGGPDERSRKQRVIKLFEALTQKN